MSVNSASGLSLIKSDGVCGLKPPLNDGQNTQLVPSLFGNKGIDSNVFTFRLGSSNANSWVDFGTPNGGLD